MLGINDDCFRLAVGRLTQFKHVTEMPLLRSGAARSRCRENSSDGADSDEVLFHVNHYRGMQQDHRALIAHRRLRQVVRVFLLSQSGAPGVRVLR
jgi:hypothetical protein